MNQHGMQLLTSYAASPANATSLSTRGLLSTSSVSPSFISTSSVSPSFISTSSVSTSTGRDNKHTSHPRNSGSSGSSGDISRRLVDTPPNSTQLNAPHPPPLSSPHPPPLSSPHPPPRWLINNPSAFHNRQVHGVLIDIQNDPQAMHSFQSLVQHQLDRIDASTAPADGEVVDALEHFFWGRTGGVALELGALDGTPHTHSMTHAYEKSLGWQRILIDANPTYRASLVEQNPLAFCVQAAICTKQTRVHYVEAKYIGGILEFMGTPFLTKFSPKLYRAMSPPGNISSFKVDVHPEVVVVECIPLAQVLNKAHVNHVNYFLLDVESGDLEVLKSIHWHHVVFDVLCIETDPVSDVIYHTDVLNT